MRPAITRIAHVELSVNDVDVSVEWYCRVLGAKDVWRGRNDEGGYRACAIREPDPDGIALEFYLLRPR